MKRISLFKKIRLFKEFRKVINENKVELSSKFNIRVDNAHRLYTVLNIPEELVGEAFSLKKSDIDRISENFIRQYSSDLATFLNSKGLQEMYSFYKSEKVDKYSYLLVYGYSLFNSEKYYKNLYYRILPISIISILTTILFLIF